MRTFSSIRLAIPLLLLIAAWPFCLFALQQAMPHQHRMPDGTMMSDSATPESPAKIEADKRFSEFNHRFAGLFVMLAGLLTLLEPLLAKRFSFIRYLWFLFFLIPGMYLFVLSDDESWPVGSQTLKYVITTNHQVLQHKIFALLLLALGIVEFLRVRKRLQSLWSVALFPALAAAGAILLLFHQHPDPTGAMDAHGHLLMQKVEHQHLGFAIVGFGIALSKAGLDWGRWNQRWMRNIFAVLMMVLGMLLLAYTE
jgi:hypothetical protein